MTCFADIALTVLVTPEMAIQSALVPSSASTGCQ